MKFKLIFAVFNGIIIISFLFVFLMPLFVLGLDYSAGFWAQNWYLVIVFVVVLLAMDMYFFRNWKTFGLLEREDWPGLSGYLETRIFEKKYFSDQSIRLLCNAWVVQGKPLEILRLETLLRQNKPSLISRYGILLGIPYLIQNDGTDMENFFRPIVASGARSDPQWMQFNLAFSLLAVQKTEEAVVLLDALAVQKKERIVQLLSLYLLDSQSAPDANRLAERQAARKEFRGSFTPSSLAQFIDKFRENLQIIILSKFISEASSWMFAPTEYGNE